MKLLIESWKGYLSELKASKIDSSVALTALSDVLLQALDGYQSLLDIINKAGVQLEAKAPKEIKVTPREDVIAILRSAQQAGNWHLWYENNYDYIKSIFVDAGIQNEEILKTFLRLLAATSQGTAPGGNVSLAMKALEDVYVLGYTEEGEFHRGGQEDPKAKKRYLLPVSSNIARIAKGEAPQGPKIGEYAPALAGDPTRVAVDRHIFEVFFGKKSGSEAKRAEAKKQIISLGEELGLSPRQVQAALWAGNQIRQGKVPGNYIEYIQKRISFINELLRKIDAATSQG